MIGAAWTGAGAVPGGVVRAGRIGAGTAAGAGAPSAGANGSGGGRRIDCGSVASPSAGIGKPGGPAGRAGATLPERPGWPDGTGAPEPGMGSAIWAGAITGVRAAAKARQNVASVERPVMRNP